ncbi:MAG: ATP-binding cassette domain-containing protein [Spirochaetota bacterium]
MAAISVKNLSYWIDKKLVLDSVSLQVSTASITGIIGGSGSGKTTLSRIILGLPLANRSHFTGKVSILEKEQGQVEKRLLQPIFQDPSLYFNPAWTLEQALLEPLDINFSLTKSEKQQRILQILDEFSLDSKSLSQKIPAFSGGELQRLCIIRSLLCQPKILIMDEPVSALDTVIQEEVVQTILSLRKDKQISILFISHDIELVLRICDSVYVMQEGKIVDSGSPEQIHKKAKHPYTQALLDSRDLSDIRQQGTSVISSRYTE